MPGPLRRRLEERHRGRHGGGAADGLTRETMTVGGVERTTWSAPPPNVAEPPPLLIVLHGAGGRGPGMAAMSGLDRRGPRAGFLTVFPDGVSRVWNDTRVGERLRTRQGVDDVAFLRALVERMTSEGRARPGGVYLAGMSNGSLMSEHVARHALLPVVGIGLIAGPGTAMSRASQPVPARPATVVMFSGTADPLIPYGGGPIGFGSGRGRGLGRGGRGGAGGGRGVTVGAETSAAEWAAANGIPGPPGIDAERAHGDDLPVTRLRWVAPGRPSVVLYRIEGGGHTWPGGAPYLPARFVGPIARTLDATGLMLDAFTTR